MANLNPMSGQPDYRPSEGVTSEDIMYLSEKRTLLSMGGTIMDDIYYSALNTTVALSEVTYNQGRLSVSLSQTQFGSQSQVIVPNSSLLSTCYLHLELPDVAVNQTLCRGWGYAAINNISFLFGSSNVSQISISGQSMLQTVWGQCESEEKRSEMLRLGGEEIIAPSAGSPTAYADLVLPLPWSSANGLHAKLPFDTGLLSNPITIQVTFNQASSIYGGSAAPQAAFSVASMYFRQGDLANKSQSLRALMMRRPELMYAYPFIHRQSFTPSNFTGVTAATSLATPSGGGVSIPLLAFINADLVAISVGVVQTARMSNVAGTASPSPFSYDDITNVSLSFNGLIMYTAPGRSYKLYDIDSQVGNGKVLNSIIAPGAVAPFSSAPIDSYLLFIDFARVRALSYEGKYANVWRIGNNTLTLNFNTTTANNYTMFATYYYNGVAEISNGETRIYFD